MNNRCFKNIVILLFVSFLAFSCQKADDNGDLGGFWKLMEIEYADGGIVDLKEKSYFMSVQLDLMQLRGHGSCYARFDHQGDSLFISAIGDDVSQSLLESFGMDGKEQRFCVRNLSSKKMVLQSHFSILRFKKY